MVASAEETGGGHCETSSLQYMPAAIKQDLANTFPTQIYFYLLIKLFVAIIS